MKMWKICLLIAAIFSLMLSSCNRGPMENAYIAVCTKEGAPWQMVNTETGEIVDGASYAKAPSPVLFGKYCVPDDEGNYYYYDIANPQKRLNSTPFVDAGQFGKEGYAFAVEAGSPIKIIDTNINVVASLPNDISLAEAFSGGVAAVENLSGKWGFVNTAGKVVVPMEYDTVESFSEGDEYTVGCKQEGENKTYYVIDRQGKVKYSIKGGKDLRAGKYSEGYVLAIRKDGFAYIFDSDGKEKCRIGTSSPNPVKYVQNARFRNGDIVFFDGRLCGLKDYEDRVTLPPMYTSMYGCRLGNKFYIASRKATLAGVIDRNNIVKIPFEFNVLDALNPQRLIGVKNDIGRLINLDGKPVGTLTFSSYAALDYAPVESDYFNPEVQAARMLNFIGQKRVFGLHHSMVMGNLRHLLYDSHIAKRDSASMTYVVDRYRAIKVGFSSPYRLADNSIDYDAKLHTMDYSFNLRRFPGASATMQKIFERELAKQPTYKKTDEHTFVRNDGVVAITTEALPKAFTVHFLFKN